MRSNVQGIAVYQTENNNVSFDQIIQENNVILQLNFHTLIVISMDSLKLFSLHNGVQPFDWWYVGGCSVWISCLSVCFEPFW